MKRKETRKRCARRIAFLLAGLLALSPGTTALAAEVAEPFVTAKELHTEEYSFGVMYNGKSRSKPNDEPRLREDLFTLYKAPERTREKEEAAEYMIPENIVYCLEMAVPGYSVGSPLIDTYREDREGIQSLFRPYDLTAADFTFMAQAIAYNEQIGAPLPYGQGIAWLLAKQTQEQDTIYVPESAEESFSSFAQQNMDIYTEKLDTNRMFDIISEAHAAVLRADVHPATTTLTVTSPGKHAFPTIKGYAVPGTVAEVVANDIQLDAVNTTPLTREDLLKADAGYTLGFTIPEDMAPGIYMINVTRPLLQDNPVWHIYNTLGMSGAGNQMVGEFDNAIAETKELFKVMYAPTDPNPVTPTEPDEPNPPEEPPAPTGPEEPDEPTQPEEPPAPTEPDEPTQPEEPDEPMQPEEPDEPAQPTEPDEPAQPEEPDEPAQPEEPDEPTQPEEPDEPAQPEEPDAPPVADEPVTPPAPDAPDAQNSAEATGTGSADVNLSTSDAHNPSQSVVLQVEQNPVISNETIVVTPNPIIAFFTFLKNIFLPSEPAQPADSEAPAPVVSEEPLPPPASEEPVPDDSEEPLPPASEEPVPDDSEEPMPPASEEPAPDDSEEPLPPASEEPAQNDACTIADSSDTDATSAEPKSDQSVCPVEDVTGTDEPKPAGQPNDVVAENPDANTTAQTTTQTNADAASDTERKQITTQSAVQTAEKDAANTSPVVQTEIRQAQTRDFAPQTGDTIRILLWGGLAVLSAAGLLAMHLYGRKTRREGR